MKFDMSFRVPMVKIREIRADQVWMDTLHPMEYDIVCFYVDNFCQQNITDHIFVIGLYLEFEDVFHELKHGSPVYREHKASTLIDHPDHTKEMRLHAFMNTKFIEKLDEVLPGIQEHWRVIKDDMQEPMNAETG